MIKKRWGIAGMAFVALLSGVLIYQQVEGKKAARLAQFSGTLLQSPRSIHSFSLQGIDGKEYNNQGLRGQWTFLFFGFTHCGSVCPTTMAELSKMYRILEGTGVFPKPRIVMISIDPERDTRQRLNQYVKAFHPQFYGARAAYNTIDAMTEELGIAYVKVAKPHQENADDFEIDHTGTLILFNPDGKLAAFFTMPHKASQLAADYQLLVG